MASTSPTPGPPAAVTQVASVWELKDADPGASRRTLYSAGMRIGRDHIASVVNTLVLAYAGAALPLLLLFSIARSGVLRVASSELVAEEIVRTGDLPHRVGACV